jgi:arylsulfatase A-like enzyme
MQDLLEDNVNTQYYLQQKGQEFAVKDINLTKKYTQINGEIALCQKKNQQFNWHGDFVFEMDDYIGRILNTLNELNVTKNTLVIFTSDNGGTMQAGDLTTRGVEASTFGSLYKLYNHNSSGKWKGMKGDIWEGGHRVPFIASWPSVIPAGKTNNNKISLTDFFATCSGILNIALPQSAAIDSYNMFETFKGKNQNKSTRENILYSSSKGCISIHKGRWKYIDCNDSGGSLVNQHIKNDYVYETAGQLYDMKKDETETTNLYNMKLLTYIINTPLLLRN